MYHASFIRFNSRFWRLPQIALVALFWAPTAFAQDSAYPNVTQFFNDNSYGTLAFVWGIESSTKISNGPFLPVTHGEPLKVPRQRVYCFAIQHYGGEPIAAPHSYTVNLYAADVNTDEKTHVHNYKKTYEITDRASADMPSYCFKRLGRSHFWMVTSSSDRDWFDGSYEFIVQ